MSDTHLDERRNAVETRALRVGVDIGGTFTDILVFDAARSTFSIGKTLTTPTDPGRAVREGLAEVLRRVESSPADIEQIIHGTTLVTNALIERTGADTALLTTRGFRDAVEIGREHRYDLYDLFLEMPAPIAPRYRRFEINERVLADGSVLIPIDEAEVRELALRLKDEGVQAVAVALLHSYQNPNHERTVVDILAEIAPELVVSASADVVPELREYERTSTTLANVYVRPVVERYLRRLEGALRQDGVVGSLFIMLSSGGVCTVETAVRYPIRLVESGPAGGALAAAHYGRLTGRSSLLSFDMGGTTAKCCLIDHGNPTVSAEFEVSRVYRFKKGSGLPVKVPVIELIEIGAGGGSIARVDLLGLLKVGPESAGADPGPACYGRGGRLPTVTDADLLLGYLDAGSFLGGDLQLDRSAAETAIAPLAAQLGLTLEQTAWGIHEVVNEQMAAAARTHAVEQGKDPREYPLFAFGGAGPVHAYRVADILRSPELVVPLGAGVTSTVGFLVAPIAFDFVRTYVTKLEDLDWSALRDRFAEMEREGRDVLALASVPAEEVTLTRSAELRYVGQGHQINVPLPAGDLDESVLPNIVAAFEEEYRALYGRTASDNPIEAMNWRLVASAPAPDVPLSLFAQRASDADVPEDPIKGRRPAYLPEDRSYGDVPVYDRYRLRPGARFVGPAIVEERESTVVIGRDAEVRVDELLNLVITLPPREA